MEAVNHVNHVEAIPGLEIDHRQTMETENTNRQNEDRRLGMEETQELRDMKLKFQEILAGLKPTMNNNIEEKAPLEQLKKREQNSETKMANVTRNIWHRQMTYVKLQMQCMQWVRTLKNVWNKEERLPKKQQNKWKQKDLENRDRATRHKNNICASCKRDILQKNMKKSNTEREKNTNTIKNKS